VRRSAVLPQLLPRLLLGLLALAASPLALAAPTPVTWQSWAFEYEVTSTEGLNLTNVTFQGHLLLARLSFPVVRVFYENDACGPYADKLGGTVYPISWANNALLAVREFTLDGKLWYEIGIRDVIGNYDLYQVYYLSADGTLEGHIYSKGLQCIVDHVHYPDWRMDFDLDGSSNDQILRDGGAGFTPLTTEFDEDASSAVNHAWRVRDVTTGLYVDVLPGFDGFSIPDGSTTEPVAGYTNHTVFGRRYHNNERAWTFPPTVQVPFNEGEDIDGEDIVLWYEGFLPHGADEGSALWHSTGVRLVSSLVPPPPDADSDGVPDATDNCSALANPIQCDSDADGFGNACDGDLDNNGFTNAFDTLLFRQQLGQPSVGPTYNQADVNCDGAVNAFDTPLFRGLLGKPPGPSGLAP
jgi:hypothetical protein